VLIRIALWDKDPDEVVKNLSLLKDMGDRQRYRVMREEVARFVDQVDFYFNEELNSIFVGDNIRRRREQLGITVANLSDELGITESHLNKVERGEGNLSIYKLVEISQLLNISLDDICHGKNRIPYSSKKRTIGLKVNKFSIF